MPRQFSYREVARALEGKLSLDFRNGAELNAWFIHDGVKINRITAPHIHRGDIPHGTLRSIRNQTLLTAKQFEDLIDCPLSGQDYIQVLRDNGHIL